MNIKIRKYRPSNRSACRGLWAELTQWHRDIYDDQTIGGEDPGMGFESYIRDERLRGPWVADLDGVVVGLTGLFVVDEEAEIEPVVVASEYRNRGIGKALIAHAVKEAKRNNVRFLSIKPVARNIHAVSVFVAAGFDMVGHIDLFQDLAQDSRREWKTGMKIHGNKLRY